MQYIQVAHLTQEDLEQLFTQVNDELHRRATLHNADQYDRVSVCGREFDCACTYRLPSGLTIGDIRHLGYLTFESYVIVVHSLDTSVPNKDHRRSILASLGLHQQKKPTFSFTKKGDRVYVAFEDHTAATNAQVALGVAGYLVNFSINRQSYARLCQERENL